MALSDAARQDFIDKNPLRRILVNSVPKCGTTWLRTMVAALPRYEEYPRSKANGLKPDQLVALQKGQVFHGHMMMSDKLMGHIRDLEIATVYIYRDLRDAVISDYFHKAKVNPKRASEFFQTHDKDDVLMAQNLDDWCALGRRYPDVRNWLQEPSIPTVTYEALKANPTDEMDRVLREMGFDANADVVAHVVEMGSFEKMSGRKPGEEDPTSGRRKGVVGDWRNHFSDAHKQSFKDRFGELLIEYGYERDLDW